MGQPPTSGKKELVKEKDKRKNRTDQNVDENGYVNGYAGLRIGTWNVRSIMTGGMKQLGAELAKYQCLVTAIQETRLHSGVMKIEDNYTLFNSNVLSQVWTSGVGFAVHNKMISAVNKWYPVNDRICWMILNAKPYKICLVNCHAPSEDADEDTKNNFYLELENVVDQLPKHSIQLVVGDFNAQVGREVQYRPMIGPDSSHEISNENGIKLINFAETRRMVIRSTYFPRKVVHKSTWISPDGNTMNQIDHVLVDRGHHGSVEHVRSFRGADMNSDHFLVIAKLRLKLSTKWRKNAGKRAHFDKDKLEDVEVRQRYQDKISEHLTSSEVPNTVEDAWLALRTGVLKSANEELSSNQKNRGKPWFDEDCRKSVETRSVKRVQWLEQTSEEAKIAYYEARRNTDKLIRKKKREHYKTLLLAVEESKSSRSFFQASRFARGIYRQCTLILTNEKGEVVPPEEQANLFKKHFEDLLNHDIPRTAMNQICVRFDGVEVPEPSEEEISVVLKALKNNKAPGGSGITAEMLRLGGETLMNALKKLISIIWATEVIPEEWQGAILCPIFKKGDATQASNYRGISLLEIGYKIFTMLLLTRMKPLAEKVVGTYQSGFTSGRSTLDHIFTLRQMIEKYYEFNRELHLLFIDFRQAYDSIDRIALWEALEEFEIPSKYIRLIAACYSHSTSQVRFGNQLSSPFSIKNGLRQGDPLAPILFNLALEKVSRDTSRTREMEMVGTDTILAFADDIVILGDTLEQVCADTSRFLHNANKIGLVVNEEKTKYLVVSRHQFLPSSIVVDGHTFERVEEFKYLGSIVTSKSEVVKEVHQRITNANRTFFSLNNLFKSRMVSQKNKTHLYMTLVRPVLLYGCETWATSATAEESLCAFERKVLRKIYGPIYNTMEGKWERRKKDDLYQRFKKPSIVRLLGQKRLQWFGHIFRAAESLPNRVLFFQPLGQRPRGRPRTRWKDRVLRILKEVEPTAKEDEARDRKKWTTICNKYLQL